MLLFLAVEISNGTFIECLYQWYEGEPKERVLNS